VAIVETENDGEIAVIRMNNPPVNALGHALRVGLQQAFAAAAADAWQRTLAFLRAHGC